MVKPLEKYVLIETISKEKTDSGLYMPEASKDKPDKGKVLAVGRLSREWAEKGNNYEIKVGDIVYYHRWSAHDLPDHKGQVLIKYEDIQGIEEKEKN